MGIQKVRTLPYHAQTNGQVEWAHQMLIHMIGKLSKDQKVNWLKHLPELVHAHNSMRLAITRYSPHYLMFGTDHAYPLTSISPWSGVHRNTNMLTTMSPSCVKDCGRPLKRLRCSPYQRQRDRSGTLIGKLTPFHWSQVTWSWLKPMPTGGRSRVLNCGGHPFLPHENKWTAHSQVLHWNWLFLIALTERTHLCMVMQVKWARCTTTTLEEQTQKSETDEAPQSVSCPSLAQDKTGETPLGWVNRRLCAFIWMFPRASLIDKGWKVWCRGVGGV